MNTHLSRRHFLAVGAAAAATVSGFPRTVFAGGDDRFGGWPIGIQSYSLRNFDVDEALRHIQGLGLHYVEFYGKHLSPGSSVEQLATMKKKLADAKISISAHGVNGFSKNHDNNRKIFEFAKAAGIRNITANPHADSFDSLDKLVEEYNIRIAIHNHGPGALYDGLKTVQNAVKDHHKLIGACVDTGHTLRSGENPVEWVEALGDRVFALHIKDVAEKQKRTHDVIIGSAHLDLVGLFKALRKVGFPKDGSISLEYESNPQNPIDDLKQCLVAAEKAIAEAKK